MPNMTKTFVASASEIQSSDLYMTIKATMFTVPEANLNDVRCTEAFLDEIVANEDKYVGLPLCADVVNLVRGRYDKLGHCYNATTDTFTSTMIGSFYKFEKEERDNDSKALVGYARVMKRNKKVCKAISELFEDGALKFSFEISCGSYEKQDDGTILIDKSDSNYLEGMCIVSFPACPDAVAQELVAEINGIGKEAEKMTDMVESAEMIAEETSEQLEIAEEKKDVESETIEAKKKCKKAEDDDSETIEAKKKCKNAEDDESETIEARKKCKKAEDEDSETIEARKKCKKAEDDECDDTTEEDGRKCKKAETENAEVYVTLEHREVDSVHTYDTESGVSTHSCVTVEENVCGLPEEAASSAEVARVAETDHESSTKTTAQIEEQLAELVNTVAALKQELAEMKTARVVAQEQKDEGIHPFVAEISAPVAYSLLESIEKNPYSLLEKA